MNPHGPARFLARQPLFRARADEPNTRRATLQGRGRIDVAAVTDRLCGCEIKSAKDSWKHLDNQVKTYGNVVDEATILTTTEKTQRATARVPNWWGVRAAERTAERWRVHVVRRGQRNPSVNYRKLAELLWADDAIALLEKHDLARGVRGKPREALWDRIAEKLSATTIRNAVTTALSAREHRQNCGGTRRVTRKAAPKRN